MLASEASLGARSIKSSSAQPVSGQIKWFDSVKGFGFLIDADGGRDILLHANVLRRFGQNSIVEGAFIEAMAVQTNRGRQVVEVLSIEPPPLDDAAEAPIAELADLSEADIAALPLLPARVKWFDRSKGFGFANVFGRKNDVFLHLEVLRRFGFADLSCGEAIGLRVFMANRGMVAAEVAAWEKATSPGKPFRERQADVGLRTRTRLTAEQTAGPLPA